MAKTVSPSKLREWQALDRIRTVAHSMNCIFRATSEDDYAIDGEIEVVVPTEDGKGLQTQGGIIKVQSKSGMSYITRDTKESFWAKVDKDDLETWHSSNVPVVYVIYHPNDNKLYWKEVKPYIRNTPGIWQPPHHIEFSKADDEFTTSCHLQLCDIAEVSPPRVSMMVQERLYSNLLPVSRLPRRLTCAPTTYKSNKDVMTTILHDRKNTQKLVTKSSSGPRLVPPFCINGEILFTLADLRQPSCELRGCCDTSKIRDVLVETWISDEAQRNDYAFLLRQLLDIQLKRLGLWYAYDFHRYYFPRLDDKELEFKMPWYSVRTKRRIRRTVAKWYEYGRDRFWRHRAVHMEFKAIGDEWFLQIEPMYFFTEDGSLASDSQKVGPYTTRIKAKERNSNVLNHVFFWADVLSPNKEKIELALSQDAEPVLIIEKMPLYGIAKFAIPDDPAEYTEVDEGMQLSFLGLEEVASQDEESDEEEDDEDFNEE